MLLLVASGCSDYLDIVPDKTQQVELLFESREKAYTSLATCYHYLPKFDVPFSSYVFASDELTEPTDHNVNGLDLMRGKQNTNEPLMSYWSGYNDGDSEQESLFRAIRDCNILIENIHNVMNMPITEKDQWSAEAQFLKAYYHFLLVANYGPIPIIDINLPISASVEEVRVPRNTVDECFNYIENTINNALPYLPERITANNPMGRIDQVIAAAIKSRVLLYAASPLFNGNSAFYETFVDNEGNKLFNTVYEAEKWKKAADAAKQAIDIAATYGVSIYTYTDAPQVYDSVNYNEDEVKALYNYRYMFTEKWNTEVIWGHSNPPRGGAWYGIQSPILMKKPNEPSEGAWQWAAPSLRMVELYYTNNGLPIDEDLSFDYDLRYRLSPVPTEDKFHAQENESTLRLHLQREPRFYASIGFDRGINRTYGEIWDLKMRAGEDHGKKSESYDNLLTGYSVKKLVHPSSAGDSYDGHVTYAWPIFRMAELYLNYAEAYNEYYGASAESHTALNRVRERSGIAKVEDAWSDATKAKTPNKHLDKDGLREIIQQERMIEMAFEGQRYYDLRRWKVAHNYFTTPIKGMNNNGTDANMFYSVTEISQRSFITPRDYLQPIKTEEIIRNSNLVQNPGW